MLNEWISACLSRPVMRRALFSSTIVGTILVAINHGDALAHGPVDGVRWFRIALTMIVPYIVSTVSSVSVMLELKAGGERKRGA